LCLVFLLAPSLAKAFSFSSLFGSPAQGATTPIPVVPNPSLALLDSPTNLNPNAGSAPDAPDTTGGAALVPHAGPSGTIADIVETPPSDQISLYVVRPGDSLADIANMYGVSVNTIIWANDLKSSKDVHVGNTLVILPVSGLKHTVVSGDTFANLAKKYGANAGEIAQFNGLNDSIPLEVGSVVIIPDGQLSVAVAPAASTGTNKSSKKSPAAPRGLSGFGGKDLSGFWTNNPLARATLNQGIHDTNAVDLGSPIGSTIRAVGPGTVIFVSSNGSYNHGWGNDVIIDHGNGVQTLYAHMSTVSVAVGEKLAGGTPIGAVGMTGDTTGPHLHIEFRGAINPFGKCTLHAVCSL
jgi:LysM repeat protein